MRPGPGVLAPVALFAAMVAAPCAAQPQSEQGETATSATLPEQATDYRELPAIEGFAIRVHRALDAEPTMLADLLDALRHDLRAVRRELPEDAMAALADVTFWIERQGRAVPGGMSGRGMCYHPSRQWLETHGILSAKAGGIEIARASDFIPWRRNQPWMVLHELAHAYHARLPAWADSEIERAFDTAMADGRYDAVEYNLAPPRETRRAYAANNHREYFAELSEAWFGLNDYAPFTRRALEAHDPAGAALMARLWGLASTQRRGGDPP